MKIKYEEADMDIMLLDEDIWTDLVIQSGGGGTEIPIGGIEEQIIP